MNTIKMVKLRFDDEKGRQQQESSGCERDVMTRSFLSAIQH